MSNLSEEFMRNSNNGRRELVNYMYHSFTKECPWGEHLTSLQKRIVDALSNVSAFNHERVPISCLQ